MLICWVYGVNGVCFQAYTAIFAVKRSVILGDSWRERKDTLSQGISGISLTDAKRENSYLIFPKIVVVGSIGCLKGFVETVKSAPAFRAKRRTTKEAGLGFELREQLAPYGALFGGKNEDMGPKTPIIGTSISNNQQVSVARP